MFFLQIADFLIVVLIGLCFSYVEKSFMHVYEILYVLMISINSYLYTFKVSVVNIQIYER